MLPFEVESVASDGIVTIDKCYVIDNVFNNGRKI